MWIIECCFKDTAWENDAEHNSHLNGFSSVWILEWVCKDHVRVYESEHTSHLKGVS